jgi:hypothetical protein
VTSESCVNYISSIAVHPTTSGRVSAAVRRVGMPLDVSWVEPRPLPVEVRDLWQSFYGIELMVDNVLFQTGLVLLGAESAEYANRSLRFYNLGFQDLDLAIGKLLGEESYVTYRWSDVDAGSELVVADTSRPRSECTATEVACENSLSTS